MQLQREMNALYVISRVLAGLLGFAALLGILWFSDSLGNDIMVAGTVMGLASIIAVLVPRPSTENKIGRITLAVTCGIGAAAGLVLVADSLGAPRGIQWDIVLTKTLHVSALLVIAWVIVRYE